MSKMKKCIPIIAFLLFISVGISKAGPTPTISYLMNTPVSMLDFGIYKLETFIFESRHRLEIAKVEPVVKVQYDFDSNIIVIIITYVIFTKDKIKDIQKIDIKRSIEKNIQSLKTFFLLNLEGKPVSGNSSEIYRYFSHIGYKVKGEPKNFGKELDQITEIYVDFFDGKKMTRCKSPLIGNELYWQNIKSKP